MAGAVNWCATSLPGGYCALTSASRLIACAIACRIFTLSSGGVDWLKPSHPTLRASRSWTWKPSPLSESTSAVSIWS
jgi:hypothetical protein